MARITPECSKMPSSKAAASEGARRTLRYVERLSEARTPLEDFFSILLGSKDVTIPRLGDAVMTIDTTTSTLDIVRQLFQFSQKQELVYDIKGVLHSAEGRLPFTNAGTLVEPGMFSDSPASSDAIPR